MSEHRKITTIDAAGELLDWSIRVLLDYHSPLPSIALATAADNILAHIVRAKEGHLSLKEALALERHSHPRENPEPMDTLRDLIRYGQRDDWLMAGRDLETEAIELIAHGIIDLHGLGGTVSYEAERFRHWVLQARPELREDEG
ncbi:hypothetical protein SAMN04488061_2538 [Filomicrobium insigne]|uniref:Uncharacterized protein n=1 Tax=Filomicrobium insigne TaxID=418854 RepID=A0A1H0QXL5_9HYPH|nr:hypothetical protein [Filomicrobium insigne]SDP21994.1 hypothetical protein SAMN04488061_2538 [Filomicrobium insigne]